MGPTRRRFMTGSLSAIVAAATLRLPVGIEFDGPQGHDRDFLGNGLVVERVFGRLPPPKGAVAQSSVRKSLAVGSIIVTKFGSAA